MTALPWPDPPLAAGEVVLRPWREADLPAAVVACNDPLIARFVPSIPQPYREDDARAWHAAHEPARREGRGLELAITAAPDAARVLGAIAMLPVDVARGSGVIGYWVAPQARGRGVASTALELVAGWAIERLGLRRLKLTADVANAASQRVAERCGFTRERLIADHLVAPGVRRDTVLYVLRAPDPALPADPPRG